MTVGRWWNAPNLLTISRIAFTPGVVWAIVTGRLLFALLLLALASATDFFDGYLARRSAMTTEFGQLLDPVADKILLSAVFIALAWIRAVPLWFVLIVFGRDLLLLIASAAMMLATNYRKLQPTVYGKGSTLLQIVTAVAILGANAFGNSQFRYFASLLIWPSALLTASSGLHYFARGLYYLWRR